jgi:hypothetical protein
MNSTTVTLCRFSQPAKINTVVVVIEKYSIATMASLDNMCGDPGKKEAWFSWHITFLLTINIILILIASFVKGSVPFKCQIPR